MRFGFLGFGKMGSALAEGLLHRKICRPEEIAIINRQPANRAEQIRALGIRRASSLEDLVQNAETVILATKPVDAGAVLEKIRLEERLLVSIVAGLSIETIQAAVGRERRVVRAMPNLPAVIGLGATAYATSPTGRDQDRSIAQSIFSAVGEAHEVPENLLDAVTGLSGSGPAYVFTFLEALIEGGVTVGLPRSLARDLAQQTLLGSAQLLRHTGEHPAVLRDRITSPAGTTLAGLAHLEEGAFRALVSGAVQAAAQRATEMGKP